jgi:hypothetical protein
VRVAVDVGQADSPPGFEQKAVGHRRTSSLIPADVRAIMSLPHRSGCVSPSISTEATVRHV